MTMSSVKKITVALICGGQSSEHEISLMSARNIFNALDPEKFHPEIIYIDKKGNFRYAQNNMDILPAENLPLLACVPGQGKDTFIFKDNPQKSVSIDIVFPVLHGLLGEDGTLQGLFKLCNLPFVGNDVLSSAINMDKDVTKRLLKQANIDTAKCLVFHAHQQPQIHFEEVAQKLSLPFFVKPANTGSSIGIHKVKSEGDFNRAIETAFRHDEKILIEEFIAGREIECAVLGDELPVVSLPGEIITHHEFYTYEAKYFDKNGADVIIPADLEKTAVARFQQIALHAFNILCCSGLARVDFFYTPQGRILLNEINTLPGFTSTSMYPKCWEAAGISYGHLVEKLVLLGLKKRRIFSV
jgi:D-alanine-D-alanine ligase